jgi:hypothetical protein
MPVVSSSLSLEAGSRADRFVPGPRTVVLCLVAVPPAVMALASEGWTRALSGLLALVGLGLVPAGLFAGRVARAVPTCAGLLLLASVLTMPFNSVAFVVNIWAAFTILMVSLPRRTHRAG